MGVKLLPMSSRRDFLTNTLAALAGSSFFVNHAQGQGGTAGRTEMTIRQAIDRIIADIPDAPFKTTVDTVKSGDPEQPLKGIVTTMFATDEVITGAIRQGANFIIAHEPTFYNHLDETDWLEGDGVYDFKKNIVGEPRDRRMEIS